MDHTTMAAGIVLMFLGSATLVGAYHIPEDGPGGIPADDWMSGNGLFTFCESLGSRDKINPLPVASSGVGGLCYASSQSFTTQCTNTLPAPDIQDYLCQYDKEADAAKKPTNTATTKDWGLIRPVCVAADPVLNPDGCLARKDASGVGENWVARIGSNARSCSGDWNQTFVYKEIVAYYAGTAPNTDGISGHVTYFVNDPFTEGFYVAEKLENVDSSTAGIDATKTQDACTGNGSQFGLKEFLGKEPTCEVTLQDVITAIGGMPARVTIGRAKCSDKTPCAWGPPAVIVPPGQAPPGAVLLPPPPYVVTVTCTKADVCDSDDRARAKVVLKRADAPAAGPQSNVTADVTCNDTSIFGAGGPAKAVGPVTGSDPKTNTKPKTAKTNENPWQCKVVFNVRAVNYRAAGWCWDP